MESNISLSAQFSAEQLASIQALIDQKVEERMQRFQQDYDDLMNKVKKQVAMSIKPSSLMPKTSIGAGAKVNNQADEESKDTPSTGQASSRLSLAGTKKPSQSVQPIKSTPSRRSDSKESAKNGTSAGITGGDKQAAEERRKELMEKKRQEEEKKKEEARVKKEELDKKRKEETDKKKQAEDERKKKLQEDKVAADKAKLLKAGGASGKASANTGAGGSLLPEEEDDPISKSLNERIKAGGVTQQVAKVGGSKPPTVTQPGLKKPTTKESTKETANTTNQGSANQTPKNAGSNQNATIKPSTGGATVNKITFGDKKPAAGGKVDDSDDPIERSLQLRIKAGGVTQVISQADAKKMGLIKTTVTAPADKTATTAGAKATDKKTVTKEEVKTTTAAAGDKIKDSTATNKISGGTAIGAGANKKPATTTNTPATTTTKATDKQAATGAGAKKTGDDTDPIDDSLKERIKAGGVTQVVEKKGGAPGAKTTTKTIPATTTTVKPKEEKKTSDAPAAKTDKPATTTITDKSKDKDADKRRQSAVGLNTAPKVMKGKKKNEDASANPTDKQDDSTVVSSQNVISDVVGGAAADVDANNDATHVDADVDIDAKIEAQANHGPSSTHSADADADTSSNKQQQQDIEEDQLLEDVKDEPADDNLLLEEIKDEPADDNLLEDVEDNSAQQQVVDQIDDTNNHKQLEDTSNQKQQQQDDPYNESEEEEVVAKTDDVVESLQEELVNGHGHKDHDELNGHVVQHNAVDFEFLQEQVKKIESYLNASSSPSLYAKISADNKDQTVQALKEFTQSLLKEIMNNEEQVEQIRTTNPDADKPIDATADNFKTSKNTDQCCIEFVKENDVEGSLWIDQVEGNDKVLKTLKLYLTLVSTYNQQSWCQFPAILDNDLFWSGAKEALTRDAESLSTFFENTLKHLDLSEQTLFRVNILLSQYEDIKEDLEPTQDVDDENAAEQNLAFFLYIIRDILVHTGFYPEITPQRQLQCALYKFEVLTAKSQEFTKVTAQLELQ